MCGIIAILFKNGTPPQRFVERREHIVDVMSHRGPDGRGVYEAPVVFLGHRRLAIIDLSERANQPMKSSDGQHHIVFNGEIYNHRELREELEQRGVRFKTTSDTEVLLEALVLDGERILPQLNGMFAFVMWDESTGRMLIARDRFGIKPLYYYEDEELLVFASEMKAIFPLVKELRPNDGILYDFLHYGRVDHVDETFFHSIRRFPAGYYAIASVSGIRFERWYDLRAQVRSLRGSPEFRERGEAEHVEEVRRRVLRAIRLRLRSDVPVGSCLSGGIDSSTIVTACSTLLEDEKSVFQTYSAVYGDWFRLDETRYIKAVLGKTGFHGNYVRPTVADLEQRFSDFMYHQEEPVSSTTPFAQYMVMYLAHSHGAKVLLDGQGADEILAGYDYMVGFYLAELLRRGRILRFIQEAYVQYRRKNRVGLKAALASFLPRRFRKRAMGRRQPHVSRQFATRFRSRRIVEHLLMDPPDLNTGLLNHVLWKLQHLLRFEDRNAMAFSIETRVPFLDHNVVEYVLALPPEYKIRRGVTKWVLREAFGDLLPSAVLQRTDKIGFATPEELWMRNSEASALRELKVAPHPMLADYVDMKWVHRILNTDLRQIPSKALQMLFRVVCLQLWLDLFFPVESDRPE